MLKFSIRSAIFALLSALSLSAQELSPEDSACLACHGQKAMTAHVDKTIYGKSVHAPMGCTSCHADLAGAVHPGKDKPQPVSCESCHAEAVKTFNSSAHAAALKAGRFAANCADCHGTHDIVPSTDSSSPVSRKNLPTTCGKCHEDVVKDVMESSHGQAMARGVKEAPSCTDCHSDHKLEALKGAATLKITEEVCSRCHASARMNSKLNLPTNRVSTFFDSYHGLSAKLGSPTAANCASCHGFHKILPSSDPKSSVHPDNLVNTCQKCHPGANEKFSIGRIHQEGNETATLGDRVNTWVKRSYIGLILAVVGGMAVHNLLGLWRKARYAYRDPHRTVVRMNLLARIQHGLLASSFIYLVLTGFALKYPDTWVGYVFGASEPIRRIGHRAAAVVMIALSFFHIFFVIFTKDGRKFVKDMWPEKKDLLDVFENIRHFLDAKKPRPKLKRFGYAEKAEYWALVWGTIIMAVSGIMLWAKMWVTQWLPRWIVDVATTVHLFEAILATLAIIIWHFYFVIFDPDIYPLNWAWFDGRVNRDHYHEEHPLDTPEEVAHNDKARPEDEDE